MRIKFIIIIIIKQLDAVHLMDFLLVSAKIHLLMHRQLITVQIRLQIKLHKTNVKCGIYIIHSDTDKDISLN